MPSDRDAYGRRRPAGHSHRLRLNRRTRGMPLSAPIEMQPLVMKSSLLAAICDLELGTPTVARLGQPTEVAGEWRPPLPSTPTRCNGCRGSFPTVWEKHVLRPTWDAMACATAATSGTPKTQLDVVLWATMESVVIVVYVSIAFMGIASLLHDAEQAHRWAPQRTRWAPDEWLSTVMIRTQKSPP